MSKNRGALALGIFLFASLVTWGVSQGLLPNRPPLGEHPDSPSLPGERILEPRNEAPIDRRPGLSNPYLTGKEEVGEDGQPQFHVLTADPKEGAPYKPGDKVKTPFKKGTQAPLPEGANN